MRWLQFERWIYGQPIGMAVSEAYLAELPEDQRLTRLAWKHPLVRAAGELVTLATTIVTRGVSPQQEERDASAAEMRRRAFSVKGYAEMLADDIANGDVDQRIQ